MTFFASILAVFLLSACVTDGIGGWNSSQAVVTKDPDSLPDMAWQTNGQRQSLIQDAKQRPSLQTVVGEAQVAKVTVAILLPLSGKSADLGQGMLKAAQMALFDVGGVNFELLPKDTADTAQGAVQAANEALAGGAELILGPLFADHVRAVKQTVAGRVPVIAFTTDWTLAGNDTYVMGFMPFAQVVRVTDFAKSRGHDKLAVIAPTTEYGNIVMDTLNRNGANIVKSLRYAPSQADLAGTLSAFVGPDKTNLPFNALMLPVGGESLSTLTALLDAQGLKNNNVKFIGTGLWDDTALTTNPALYGSWFAASDPALRRDFERRYRDN